MFIIYQIYYKISSAEFWALNFIAAALIYIIHLNKNKYATTILIFHAIYEIINTINETKTNVFVLMYLLYRCEASRLAACNYDIIRIIFY